MEDITYSDVTNGIFNGWKVREGVTVRAGAVVMVYKEGEDLKQVKTDLPGVVHSLAKLKNGDQLVTGQFLVRLRPCDHPVVMKDLCADCGEDLRKREGLPGERVVQTQARVAMIHHIPELQITPEEAKSYGTADERNLLKQRKLVLLVDLDQTLIHTTNEDVNPNLKDVHHFQLYGSNSPWYHTRLRPHTRHFLQTVSDLYELHICTFGARLYAHTVAKILDPNGTLFGHRILSREECFDASLKIANLKALFPCGDRLVCIIDDREDVWNYALNVVHVKPYKYFKHTGDINAPPGFAKNSTPPDYANSTGRNEGENPSTSSTSVDPNVDDLDESKLDNDEDDYLYHLEDILVRVHTAFYQMHDQLPDHERPPDMKSVVPYVKSKVLAKCNIVFSGVVPTNVPIENSSIYKAAASFGATVHKDIVVKHRRSATTHLVAAKWGTSKVYEARKAGRQIKIVTPQWLWCCVERWEREDERLFQLPIPKRTDNKRMEYKEEDAYSKDVDGPTSGSVFTDGVIGGEISESFPSELPTQEPDQKKRKLEETDEKDNDTISVYSQSSSSRTSSKSDPETSVDEEMAEALEKVFE